MAKKKKKKKLSQQAAPEHKVKHLILVSHLSSDFFQARKVCTMLANKTCFHVFQLHISYISKSYLGGKNLQALFFLCCSLAFLSGKFTQHTIMLNGLPYPCTSGTHSFTYHPQQRHYSKTSLHRFFSTFSQGTPVMCCFEQQKQHTAKKNKAPTWSPLQHLRFTRECFNGGMMPQSTLVLH